MKFRVGDVCVIVDANDVFDDKSIVGMQVTVAAFQIRQSNGREFYTVEELSPHWFADNELRKVDNGHEPADEEFTDWLRKQVKVAS